MPRRLVLLWFFLATPSIALGQQPEGKVGGSPLCVWEINATLLAYAEHCHVDEGTDRRAALEESVRRLERFIMDNSDLQQWQLDGAKAEMWREQTKYDFEICDPTPGGLGGFYKNAAATQSPDEMRAWIERYVSAPRDPADGGCL
jgi:hypothetical protein